MAIEKGSRWRPGSFTKNFRWGRGRGLKQLYDVIRLGFANEPVEVSRNIFKARIASSGLPDYIPLNFFLFNEVRGKDSVLVVDELVWQALNFPHSSRFDNLAVFAFNFSYVGVWKDARPYIGREAKGSQSRPALWASEYISKVVAQDRNWDVSSISADDIERFLRASPEFSVEDRTYRKVATNLSFLYEAANLAPFAGVRIERWWVDALFLALDRLIGNRVWQQLPVQAAHYIDYLNGSTFNFISGRRSIEKDLAVRHLVALYEACGDRLRFSESHVADRTKIQLPDLQFVLPLDLRPRGAVHRTNPRILKAIPRACAMLAKNAGFEDLSPDELENFDLSKFIDARSRRALEQIRDYQLTPSMTAEDLLRLTRGE